MPSLNCGPGSQGRSRRGGGKSRAAPPRRWRPSASWSAWRRSTAPSSMPCRTADWDAARAPRRRRHGHRQRRAWRWAFSPPIARRCCSPTPKARVIGAAHAGWKGALGGRAGSHHRAPWKSWAPSAARIAAAIGPCISQANYEVGQDFRDRFLELDPSERRFFVPSRQGRAITASICPAMSPHRLARGRDRRCRHDLGLCTYPPGKRLFQLPPHHPSRRARLWAANLGHCADQ